MREVFHLVLRLLRPYRKIIITSTLIAVVAAALETIGPIIMGRGFDIAAEQVNSGKFILLAFLWPLLLWMLTRLFAARMRSLLSQRGENIGHIAANQYVNETMSDLLHYPLSFHYEKKATETAEKLSTMRWRLSGLIQGFVFDFGPALIAIIGITGYLFFISWKIGLSLLLTTIVFVFYTWKMAAKMKDVSSKWHGEMDRASTFGWDMLGNVLVVKSTSNEKYVRREILKLGKKFEKVQKATTAEEKKFRDMQDFIIIIGSSVIVFTAVSGFANGAYSFGLLSAITAYAFTVFGYVRFIQWRFQELLYVVSNYSLIQESLNHPIEDFSSGKNVALGGKVEFRHIRFRYREEKPALEDVSFVVPEGSKVALVGESGVGKTTLIDLIARYYAPQKGQIFIDDKPIEDINLRTLRDQIAYVPQDLSLFHESIEKNIWFGNTRATKSKIREAAKLAHLDTFIEGLPEGYDTTVGKRGLKLSGGERQRVALARAFIQDPKILILDEPTSNLDSKTEASIQDSLRHLTEGRTTFTIAHRLKTVMDADMILVLKDGVIAETGTHEELIKRKGAYLELLKAQTALGLPDET